jgi:hypothetical protein
VAIDSQAADAALRAYGQKILSRIDSLIVISDDSDFVRLVNQARKYKVQTTVVGQVRGRLGDAADEWLSWTHIRNGVFVPARRTAYKGFVFMDGDYEDPYEFGDGECVVEVGVDEEGRFVGVEVDEEGRSVGVAGKGSLFGGASGGLDKKEALSAADHHRGNDHNNDDDNDDDDNLRLEGVSESAPARLAFLEKLDRFESELARMPTKKLEHRFKFQDGEYD